MEEISTRTNDTTEEASSTGLSAERLQDISKECQTSVTGNLARAVVKGLGAGLAVSAILGPEAGIPAGLLVMVDKVIDGQEQESNSCQLKKIEQELGITKK